MPRYTTMNKLSLLLPLIAVSSLALAGPAQKSHVQKTKTPVKVASGGLPSRGEDVGVIDTNLGRIVVRFFPGKAPGHVKNFEKLARKGFYNGTKFHRVIPGFMIQGGDPNSKDSDRTNDGMGGPGYQINAEFNDIHHGPGVLSMARSSDPNSAGSQFFIMVADNAGLDHQYTAFGKVVSGMDVVNKIVSLPRDPNDNPLPGNPAIVKSIKIMKWPVKGR
jgi:peptidyl-prolyl cis-trans isomerase B (cyclophilin B)